MKVLMLSKIDATYKMIFNVISIAVVVGMNDVKTWEIKADAQFNGITNVFRFPYNDYDLYKRCDY